MDLEALLQPHAEDAVSGENLEYDPVFTELELAAQPGEERQMGDEVLSAEEPDYRDIRARALEVLGRSHDLRAAVLLGMAGLRLNGFLAFAETTTFIRRCLEDYWETCHPQLDEDDGDPTMRVNAVLALADADATLRALRLAPMSDSRMFGRVSLRDVAVAAGEMAASADMDTVPDSASISAALQDTDPDFLKSVAEAVATATENIAAITAVFDEKTPGEGPDLSPIEKLLRKATRQLSDAGASTGPEPEAEADAEPLPGVGGAVQSAAPGAIASSNDVINTLDRIISYYEQNEPSSPVPILLVRARRLVNADFLTIIKDMTPDGILEVRRIGGIEEGEH